MKGFWGYKTKDGFEADAESKNGIGTTTGEKEYLWCDRCDGKGTIPCSNKARHPQYTEESETVCPKCDYPNDDTEEMTCPTCGGGDAGIAKGHYRALKPRPTAWVHVGRHRAAG